MPRPIDRHHSDQDALVLRRIAKQVSPREASFATAAQERGLLRMRCEAERTDGHLVVRSAHRARLEPCGGCLNLVIAFALVHATARAFSASGVENEGIV